MRALVTGITGFVGGHLAELLLAQGVAVTGCSRSGRWPTGLEHLEGNTTLVACDLTESGSVQALFERHEFDTVFHLAGMANPSACRSDPAIARRTNVTATANLYRTICSISQRPRVVYVSSAYVYGQPGPGESPISSAAPVNANDPYAATKWEAEQLGIRFAADEGLAIVRVRTFNHVGPRQPAGYIVSDWTRQIAEIEKGYRAPVLRVGNVESRRDYSDVRDIVRAYYLLAREASFYVPSGCDVLNLGSGSSWCGRDILERLSRFSRVAWRWEVDPLLLRPGESAEIVADATPLRERTGWRPEINFDTTIRDTLDYWRSISEHATLIH
jgi:GDP-4-dehydro-6-deoxy-D-mannose reductase